MRRHVLPVVTLLLFSIGISLLLYPSAASWVTQYNQSKIVDSYESKVQYSSPSPQQQLEAAHEYNERLAAGVDLRPGERIPISNGKFVSHNGHEGLDYDSILRVDSTGLMARIRIPAINVDLPVYHGSSDETLLRGAGHLYGSSLPVGGKGTRTVITAHRGLANATMFTNLNQVKHGDLFYFDVLGEILSYKVVNIQVVEPQDRETVRAVAGEDLATLITCTPLGINSHRIVVTGKRVSPVPHVVKEKQGKPSTALSFPWWLPVWVVSLLLLPGYGIHLMLLNRRQKNQQINHS